LNGTLFVTTDTRRDEIDILYTISNQLSQAETPPAWLDAVSLYARECGATSGSLFWVGDDQLEVAAEWSAHEPDTVSYASYAELPIRAVPGLSTLLEAWTNLQSYPLLLTDIPDDFCSIFPYRETRSGVILPLHIRERWVGIIAFGWNESIEFDQRDNRIYTVIIQQTTPVIDSMRLYARSRERAERAEHLLRVNTALSEAVDECDILNALTLYTEQVQGADALTLSYINVDENGVPNESFPVAVWIEGTATSVRDARYRTLKLADYDLDRLWMHNPDRPLIIENIATETRLDESIRASMLATVRSRAYVIVPLYSRGRYQGVLAILWFQPRKFSEQEISIYTAFTQIVAATVASRRAYLAEEEAREESEMLYKASEAINAAKSFSDIVEAVARFGIDTHGVALTIWENYDFDHSTYFEVVAVSENSKQPVGIRYPTDDYPIAHRLRTAGVSVIEDMATDPNVDPVSAASWMKLGTYARIGMALVINDRWLGSLAFLNNTPRVYTPRERRLVAGIGGLVAAALDRMRLQDMNERGVTRKN
jgi:GAF domain-containing protein